MAQAPPCGEYPSSQRLRFAAPVHGPRAGGSGETSGGAKRYSTNPVLVVGKGVSGYDRAVVWRDRSLHKWFTGFPARRALRGLALHGPIGPAVGAATGAESRPLGRT
jgi:hypothetical protein